VGDKQDSGGMVLKIVKWGIKCMDGKNFFWLDSSALLRFDPAGVVCDLCPLVSTHQSLTDKPVVRSSLVPPLDDFVGTAYLLFHTSRNSKLAHTHRLSITAYRLLITDLPISRLGKPKFELFDKGLSLDLGNQGKHKQ
jgi:hypothetical protein